MNYREFDPSNPCLDPAAYIALWGAASKPRQLRLSLRDKAWNFLHRLATWLPAVLLLACVPPQLQGGGNVPPPPPSAEPAGFQAYSLVWVQPHPGRKMAPPPTLPRPAFNPYSF
jgi:hypothetical protein